MMGFQFPESLQRHRPLLLACEAIGCAYDRHGLDRFPAGAGGQGTIMTTRSGHEQESPRSPG
jgi:hypothetical protein